MILFAKLFFSILPNILLMVELFSKHSNKILINYSLLSISARAPSSNINMPNSKSILKLMFALGVWSFVVIGLVKLHGHNVILDEYPQAPLSGRLLLQKDSKTFFDATSTTTDKVLPYDVLIDSRQGECTLFVDAHNFFLSYISFFLPYFYS